MTDSNTLILIQQHIDIHNFQEINIFHNLSFTNFQEINYSHI